MKIYTNVQQASADSAGMPSHHPCEFTKKLRRRRLGPRQRTYVAHDTGRRYPKMSFDTGAG